MQPPKNGGSPALSDRIPFDEAVTEGRNIIESMEREERGGKMRLGELADGIEPIYRDRTVAKYAEELGVAACKLKRYLSVWRAWDGQGIEAPGPVSYAVLRELQGHPDRQKIVEENPKITRREATKGAHTRENNKKANRKRASRAIRGLKK